VTGRKVSSETGSTLGGDAAWGAELVGGAVKNDNKRWEGRRGGGIVLILNKRGWMKEEEGVTSRSNISKVSCYARSRECMLLGGGDITKRRGKHEPRAFATAGIFGGGETGTLAILGIAVLKVQ